ncbi:MAG: helicase HerA domain-containing protein, partial [Dehalococcoidia bacterium]
MNAPQSGEGDGASPVPEAARAALLEEIDALGGPLVERPEDAASAGRTMFDTPGSEDQTLTVLVPRERMRSLPSQALVRIESREDGRTYLGVVVAGPFAEPDGLRGDAPVVVTAAVNGGMFLPRYHGRVHVEILGEQTSRVSGAQPPSGGGWGRGANRRLEPTKGWGGAARVSQLNEALVPPRYRPLPNSPVFPLSAAETAHVLKAGGDVRLGLAVGHDDVAVAIDSRRKDLLPRHTGILGTTGGGKSTTVAGLIARLQASGVAVVLLDTEGEYTHLNEPADDPTMLAALYRLGLREAGVPDTHVFHLVGRETANPEHPDVRPFRLRFSDLPAEAVMELLELTDAQRDRYWLAYDTTKALMRELGAFPRPDHPADQQALLTLDELESGYPGMTLGSVLDVATAFLRALGKKQEGGARRSKAQSLVPDGDTQAANDDDPQPLRPVSPLFQRPEHLQRLKQRVAAARGDTGNESSWRALLARLRQLERMRVFDNERARTLPVAEMLATGRVSIIDLHDSDSPAVNNIVIAG